MQSMTERILTFDPQEFDSLCDRYDMNMVYNGAFLDKESYTKLLDLADIYFGLGMRTDNCPLPLQPQCYMLITKKQNRLSFGLGKNVRLKVDRIIYNQRYGLLAAGVSMIQNFTCNRTPHIIIAKSSRLINSVVTQIIDGELDHRHPCVVRQLHAPCVLHGRIGAIFGSKEEYQIPETITSIHNGEIIHISPKKVMRPEVSMSIENHPPPNEDRDYLNIKDLEKDDEVMDIQVGGSNNQGKEHTKASTGDDETEMYDGCVVVKGPRGGKYYYKDGKKRYVTDEQIAARNKGGKKEKVIFKINLME